MFRFVRFDISSPEIIIPIEENRRNAMNFSEWTWRFLDFIYWLISWINSEINKIVVTALHIGEPNSIPSISAEESIISFNKEYQLFKTNFPESAQLWEAQIDGEILYLSPEIICIAITTYINTGGAHGNLNISFLSILQVRSLSFP